MKRLLIVGGMFGAFLLGLATPALTQMDHPRVRAAEEHLRLARAELANAAHEYGGHRKKALEHVDKALEECHRAIEFAE
jgi:hypothetical protein